MPTPEVAPSPIAEEVAALLTEAGLATILDGIGDGFYALDRDWRIILFNRQAERHFGRPAGEMLGHKLWELFPGARDTGLGRLFVNAMEARETVHSETESVLMGARWLSYRLFPLSDGMGVVFRDMTARKRAEEQRDLLIKELEHRVKNTLAIVQSIAAQTFRQGGVDPAVQRAFEGRLIALSNVHGMLTQQSWDSAELHDVVRAALRAHGVADGQRLTVEGPAMRLSPQSAVAFSMAVHELATNAIKYGALSSDAGRVDVSWSVADGRFRWSWRERGGPKVAAPTHKGFGSRMIERALALQLSGEVAIEYQPDGVICTINARPEAVHDHVV